MMSMQFSNPLHEELALLDPKTVTKVRVREQKQKETPIATQHRNILMGKLPMLADKIRAYLVVLFGAQLDRFFSVENKTVLPLPYIVGQLVASFEGKYTRGGFLQHLVLTSCRRDQ